MYSLYFFQATSLPSTKLGATPFPRENIFSSLKKRHDLWRTRSNYIERDDFLLENFQYFPTSSISTIKKRNVLFNIRKRYLKEIRNNFSRNQIRSRSEICTFNSITRNYEIAEEIIRGNSLRRCF